MANMSRETELSDLLSGQFSSDEIRRLLGSLSDGRALTNALPGGNVPHAQLAYAAMDVLRRHGQIDQELFDAILAQRSKQLAEIAPVAARFGVQLSAPGSAGSSAQSAATSSPASASASPSKKIKILFLASNPSETGRLMLDREYREIEQRLTLARRRDDFELIPAFAVRTGDMRQKLLDHEPDVVHFAGHGTPDGLIFEGQRGPVRVEGEVLGELFEVFKDSVKIVVFNACYSKDQVEPIVAHIPVAVGMDGTVKDGAGVLFADGLYQALAAGRSVQDAVRLGRVSYRAEGYRTTAEPVIVSRPDIDPANYKLR